MKSIRTCFPSDLPYVGEICHWTADSGRGAEGRVPDRFMVGHYFASPYVQHDPAQCRVLCEDGLPVGYVVGTADSAAFYAWMEAAWLPGVRTLYEGRVASNPFEDFMLRCIRKEPVLAPALADWPGHIHINILDGHRGGGFGRRLIESWEEGFHARGGKAYHLGVGEGNEAAIGFYRAIGFEELYRGPGVVWMGKRLEG